MYMPIFFKQMVKISCNYYISRDDGIFFIWIFAKFQAIIKISKYFRHFSQVFKFILFIFCENYMGYIACRHHIAYHTIMLIQWASKLVAELQWLNIQVHRGSRLSALFSGSVHTWTRVRGSTDIPLGQGSIPSWSYQTFQWSSVPLTIVFFWAAYENWALEALLCCGSVSFLMGRSSECF